MLIIFLILLCIGIYLIKTFDSVGMGAFICNPSSRLVLGILIVIIAVYNILAY